MNTSTEVRAADPCTIVIFGGSGDLTKRKLIPALANLMQSGLLSERSAVIGFSADDWSHDQFRAHCKSALGEFASEKVDATALDAFLKRFYYQKADFNDKESYWQLNGLVEKAEAEHKTGGNRLMYLAIPPDFFATAVENLGAGGVVCRTSQRAENECGWHRVIIEKPFGRDITSARELNSRIQKVLDEDQIYRIDHYLGKETVQNIMLFRFANGIYEPMWDRRYIESVQITVAESIGIEDRGKYYDRAGCLRDILQNHLLQLLTLIAMEPPISFEADDVRNEKVKVLNAIHPMSPEQVFQRAVRGQYGHGTVDGTSVRGYRDEGNVNPKSMIETFCAMKLFIDNWRWAGVPFYLRSGKRMAKRLTQAIITYRMAPLMLLKSAEVQTIQPNRLILNIQPKEGISLMFEAKMPGQGVMLKTVTMDFWYEDYFHSAPQTGYENLIYDCMCGDASLFHRDDMVMRSWDIVMPVLDVWAHIPDRDFPNYAAGSWGPKSADQMLEGRSVWWNPR